MRLSGIQPPVLLMASWPLVACGDGPLVQDAPTSGPLPREAAAVVVVSGDGQEGKAGERLAERLVIRVTDAHGGGVGRVPVRWAVTAGAGSLHSARWTSRSDGLAWATFEPERAGPNGVTARVATAGGIEEATFTVEVIGVVISIHDNFGWSDFVEFEAPDGSSDVTVPVGTTVEWVNWAGQAAVIASTRTPPGGASFESGRLSPGDRFEFVPHVAGTWRYVDRVSRATAALTARPRR